MNYFKRLLLNAGIFLLLAFLYPNMLYVDGVVVALIASAVFSILNALVKPILQILSFPITLITFGLFTLVINGFILNMTSLLVGKGTFYINGFGSAVMLSIIISLVNMLVQATQSSKNE